MGDDIPKVESEALKEEAQATMVVNQLKALANMSSISEEVVEEILEKTPTKSGLDKSLSGLVSSAKDEAAAAGGATEKPSGKYSKEKLIAKLPNLNNLNIRKKLSESERDGGSSGGSGGGGGGGAGSGGSSAGSGARESAGGLGVNQAGGSDGGGGGNPASSSSSSKKSEKKSLIESGSEKVKNATERLSEKRKQKKEQQQQQKEQLLDNNGGIQMQQLQSQQHQQLSQQTSQQQQQPEISIEEVEALIRTKNLPSETITIHSPGSGTTII